MIREKGLYFKCADALALGGVVNKVLGAGRLEVRRARALALRVQHLRSDALLRECQRRGGGWAEMSERERERERERRALGGQLQRQLTASHIFGARQLCTRGHLHVHEVGSNS
jgi:hypothetical protein